MEPSTRPADSASRPATPPRRSSSPPSGVREGADGEPGPGHPAPPASRAADHPDEPRKAVGARLGPLSGVSPRVPDLVRRGDALVKSAEPRPVAPAPSDVADRARAKELHGLATRIHDLSPVIEAAIADLGSRWTSAGTMREFRDGFTAIHADCARTIKEKDLPAARRALDRLTSLALDVQAKFIDKEDLPNGDLVKVGIEGGATPLPRLEADMRQLFSTALARVDRMLVDPEMPSVPTQHMRKELLDLQQRFLDASSDQDLPEARVAYTRTLALHHRMLGADPVPLPR